MIVVIIALIPPQCSSQNTTRLSIQPQQYSYTYKVKIVNLSKKSVYSMTHLEVTHQFESLHDLKQEVHKAIPAASNHSYGYMEPGHGLKGKQRLLLTSDDLAEMYQMHKNKREIVLWCYGKVEVSDQSTISTNRKRSRSPDKPEETMRNKPGSTKKQALANKIKDVEDIVLKLQDKHGSDYSVEKLNAWAHLIHTDKHGSYDTPPNLPYFKKPTNKAKENNGANVPQHHKSGSSGLSPSKRLGFRSECIDQLSKWHALMEKDGITREQYEELKNTIMGDISTF